MKISIIFFLFFLLLFNSCQDREIIIDDIKVPEYYIEYNYREFWESKGFNFSYSHEQKRPMYIFRKDKSSTNFLNVSETLNGLIKMPEEARLQYLKNDGFKIKITNEDYEIYQSHGNAIFSDSIQNYYNTFFIVKKDSISFAISYQTFDNDVNKLKDYKEIVMKIENELLEGRNFKSVLNKK